VRAIRRRIKQRGRPSEQAIPVSYIRTLNKLYEEWIEGWTHSPVYILDTEQTDYLENLVDRITFHKAIEKFL
jgi:deoxyadenosine/deoxycytidine kinase